MEKKNIVIKKDCPCRWKSCKRHGRCVECIEHHRGSEKYPEPACRRIRRPIVDGRKADK